jgi:hypothetical protein
LAERFWKEWVESNFAIFPVRPEPVEVSYSKAFKKEAEILKIEPFNITKSPNRWRYSRYEEA